MNPTLRACTATLAISLLHGGLSFGGTVSIPGGKGPSVTSAPTNANTELDRIWSLFSLYKSGTGAIREIRLIGRYQGQYFDADSADAQDSDWSNRRARLGLRATLFDNSLIFNAEASSSDKFDPLYNELTEGWLEYKPNKNMTLRVGKFMPAFGYDYGVSSREILTFERSQLPNQMGVFFAPGARLTVTEGSWTFALSGFSNSVDKEYGDFGGGYSVLPSVARDLSEQIGMDKAVVRLDYLYTDAQEEDTRFNFFENAVSLNFSGKQGPVGLNADLMAGFGDKGDATMIMVMPTYDITDKLQLVARYTFTTGDEGAVRPQRRYESRVNGTAGDNYQSIYGGINYYLYGHKLKTMLGAEYSTMDGGEDVTTLLAGVRISW
jgi:hypothetical protein